MNVDTLSYVLLPQHFKHGEQDMRNRHLFPQMLFLFKLCVYSCVDCMKNSFYVNMASNFK